MFFICSVYAQPILLEEMVTADELICFPVYGKNNIYKYLPNTGALSMDNGTPEFSFLQYAFENEENVTTSSSITQALGGGLLHFLVEYYTPDRDVKRAEQRLKRMMDNDSVQLVGPVDVTSSQFVLVSSILIDGQESKELIGMGKAPVFQNSKVAFSFMLDQKKSQILMESFKMSTPDISIMFDLQFKGLTSAYNGKVMVDWNMVQNSSYSNTSVDAIFFSSDTEETFLELTQVGAITMESYGADSLGGDMLNAAYDKLLKMMYEPMQPDSINEADSRSWVEKTFGSRGLGGSLIGGSSVYRKRTIKTSGKTTVELNSRQVVDRHHFVTFNIGDLHKNYGENESVFRKAALDEDLFKQREIIVNIDGDMKSQFEEMVNSVAVSVKKEHENGEETVREVFFSAPNLEEYKGPLKMVYLNKKDIDKENWLKYKYAVNWQFKRDGEFQTTWKISNAPVINLYAPYKSHLIDLMGDMDKLKEMDIMAVVIQIEYPFFGKMKREKRLIKPFNNDNDMVIKAILPNDIHKVNYTITWVYNDGNKISTKGEDEFGVLLIDELPQSE